ncbi:MAG: hypothetical protein PVI60_02295 [Desulfobacteraceae bacterium]|jgi:hypothetical protein
MNLPDLFAVGVEIVLGGRIQAAAASGAGRLVTPCRCLQAVFIVYESW